MTVAKVHAREGAWLREERLAPLAGLGVLAFGLAGLIVLEGPANRPEIDVAPREFVTYFGKGDSVVLGSFLIMPRRRRRRSSSSATPSSTPPR